MTTVQTTGDIPKAYFDTRFSLAIPPAQRPEQFAIITAVTDRRDTAANAVADADLQDVLFDALPSRILASSATTVHAEASWLVATSLATACRIGHMFDQVAIFYVIGDGLYITLCEAPVLVYVAPFGERCPQAAAWR
jgi:hypothetical protein